MQTYETLFIIRPDLEESEIDKTIDAVQNIITSGGGTILKVDKWGKRQLAYMIQKKREGFYVLMYFEAPSTLIAELQRRYKLADAIMRYLVVQPLKSQVEEILEKSQAGITDDDKASQEDVDTEETPQNADLEPDEQLVASTEDE